ncbi:MAG: SusD/RagB family nutrient-binding outer rane lipoprotein [Chitinophagaceae bacterium]|nr:SusD/RagB family nutrient-binding outer rane lipoprotein [Chitinophagaceae bacterium]
MNARLYIGTVALALIFSAGCTKRFDTINQNPNQPDHVDNEQLFLPAIIKNSVRNYSYISQFGGSVIGDYYANQYNSGFDDAFTASQTEGSFLWNFFNVLKDVENYRILSHQKGDKNNEGVGLVMRCWMFQVMTDNYGDMPYSQAVQGKTSDNFQPAYDKQEDIYYALMDSLKKANSLLATGTDPINSDILMGGSALRWQEFANGLRLRLLMRMSNVTGAKVDVGAEMNAIAADPATYPLFQTHSDQAALEFLTDNGFEFPAYHNSPIGDYHLSTTLQTNLNLLNDPRIAYFAMPTPASLGTGTPVYAGVPNGIGTTETSYNGGTNNQSQEAPILMPVAGYSFSSPTAAQGILLSCAEVQFILAEGKERGLITGGSDAATYYMNGIQDQFDYDESRLALLTLPFPADITPDPAYFTQPGVAYTGTTNEKLYKIRIQRWFSMFYTGFEGWSEWRRTGVPKETVTGPSSAIPEWPRRIRYPLSEQTVNTTNYNAVLQAQGPDDLVTKLWWNK